MHIFALPSLLVSVWLYQLVVLEMCESASQCIGLGKGKQLS